MSYDSMPTQVGALDRLEWLVKQVCERLGVPIPERERIQEYAQLRAMEEAFNSWKDEERSKNLQTLRERHEAEAKAREATARNQEREIGCVVERICQDLFGMRTHYWYDIREARFKERFDDALKKRFEELMEAHFAERKQRLAAEPNAKPENAESSDEKPPKAGEPDGQPGQAGS